MCFVAEQLYYQYKFIMEFPKLGCHCSEPSCKKLDFLPIKCDCCAKIYCNDHFKYNSHSCPFAYKNNVQVPECPLCGVPVPIPRHEQPDVSVGAHIDRDCKWDPSKERKVFINKCTMKGCKTKEIIPVLCSDCQNNFCLRHRHPADHSCVGTKASVRSKIFKAVTERSLPTKSINSTGHLGKIQDQNMSEDEALARAIALSLNGENSNITEIVEIQNHGRSPVTNQKNNCSLS